MTGRALLSCIAVALVAVVTTGCSGCGAPVEQPPPPAAAASRPAPRWVDATAEAGITFRHVSGAYGKKYLPETMGAGVAVLDYDGDGRPDLYFPNGTLWPDAPDGRKSKSAPPLPALYHNDGNGRFTDRTREAGLAESFYGMGATAADFDNDGDQDLFVTALGPDRLYRNDRGTFTEVGGKAGVNDPGFGSSAAFLDHDQDGDLDLFVCNYVEWSIENDIFCSLDGQAKSYCTPESYRGQSNHLYRNDGQGRFTDVSREAGVHNPAGKSLGVTTTDYDGDGWLDLAVANDTQPNYLYRNNHDGTFTDVGREVGVAFSESGVARGAMGIDSGDYDLSGRESLVIGNFSNEMVGLYHNEGSGLFIDDAARAGVGLPSLLTLAFGCFFFDHDLDGHADIFVANGHVEDDINRVQKDVTYAQKPHLFRNKGDGSFEAVGSTAPPDDPLNRAVVGRGAAYLDHDGDGDLDILMTTNNGPAYLLRNEGGNTAGWLRVRLAGSRSNRDGVGARVLVTAAGRTQSVLIKTGSSYCSQSEMVATFGLGSSERADKVEIIWPGGAHQVVESVPSRTMLLVREDGTTEKLASLP
ncbi:MAG: CRTAC1 family protein [Candidatus Polarisedimenticolia bacterium]